MPTFAQQKPLTERITDAKRTLDQTRKDGHQPYIEAAERVLNGLIDRLPIWRPLEDSYPELDKQLRVDMH